LQEPVQCYLRHGCVSAWKSDPVFGVIGVQN
jgi:hypothetical protein